MYQRVWAASTDCCFWFLSVVDYVPVCKYVFCIAIKSFCLCVYTVLAAYENDIVDF